MLLLLLQVRVGNLQACEVGVEQNDGALLVLVRGGRANPVRPLGLAADLLDELLLEVLEDGSLGGSTLDRSALELIGLDEDLEDLLLGGGGLGEALEERGGALGVDAVLRLVAVRG